MTGDKGRGKSIKKAGWNPEGQEDDSSKDKQMLNCYFFFSNSIFKMKLR
jgi:hypothetical protein